MCGSIAITTLLLPCVLTESLILKNSSPVFLPVMPYENLNLSKRIRAAKPEADASLCRRKLFFTIVSSLRKMILLSAVWAQ